MVVEDNPADVGLVRKALELHNVEGEMMVFTDGEKAIQFLETVEEDGLNGCLDLAIIDLNLPKRSGREVLELLRLNSKYGEVPIVILSSSDAKTDKDDAARLGATQYIRKPTRLEEFLSIGVVFRNTLNRS